MCQNIAIVTNISKNHKYCHFGSSSSSALYGLPVRSPKMATMVKLKSSQGEVFEVEEDVACMSQLVKNMVEDSGADEEIPLPNVKTAILSKVLDYCKFHKDAPPAEIQKPLKSANLAECGVREWDVEYVDVEQEILFELILAANYLDIKALLDLTCAKVASATSALETVEPSRLARSLAR